MMGGTGGMGGMGRMGGIGELDEMGYPDRPSALWAAPYLREHEILPYFGHS